MSDHGSADEDPVLPGAALALVVRTARAKSNRSGVEVARRARISRSYLAKIEAGDVIEPSAEVVERLACALDIKADELFAVSGRQPSSVSQRHVLAELHRTQLEMDRLRATITDNVDGWRERLDALVLPVDQLLFEAGKALSEENTTFAETLLRHVLASRPRHATQAALRAHIGLSDVARLRGDVRTALIEVKRGLHMLHGLSGGVNAYLDLRVSLLYRMAALEADLGKVTTPRAHIDEAIRLRRVANVRDLSNGARHDSRTFPPMAELHRISGIIFTVAGRWAAAAEEFQKSLDAANDARLDDVASATHSNIVWLRIREGKLAAALDSCRESISLKAQQIGHPRRRSHGYGYLSAIALAEYERVVDQLADPELSFDANDVQIFSLVEYISDQIDQSDLTGDPRLVRNGDRRFVAEAQIAMALFAIRQQSDEQRIVARAIDNGTRALRLFDDLGDRCNAAEACLTLAGIFQQRGLHGRAALAARRALDYAVEIEFALLEARARRRLALVLLSENDEDESLYHMLKSWNILEQSGVVEDPYERARTRRELGRLYAMLARRDSRLVIAAMQHLRAARDAFEELNAMAERIRTECILNKVVDAFDPRLVQMNASVEEQLRLIEPEVRPAA